MVAVVPHRDTGQAHSQLIMHSPLLDDSSAVFAMRSCSACIKAKMCAPEQVTPHHGAIDVYSFDVYSCGSTRCAGCMCGCLAMASSPSLPHHRAYGSRLLPAIVAPHAVLAVCVVASQWHPPPRLQMQARNLPFRLKMFILIAMRNHTSPLFSRREYDLKPGGSDQGSTYSYVVEGTDG